MTNMFTTLRSAAVIAAFATVIGFGSLSAADTAPAAGATATDASATKPVSNDDKHKLYQAAASTGDATVIQDTMKRLALFNADGTPKGDYQTFVGEHGAWAQKNIAFIQEMANQDKAKEYVKNH